jgi:hypothetical protein
MAMADDLLWRAVALAREILDSDEYLAVAMGAGALDADERSACLTLGGVGVVWEVEADESVVVTVTQAPDAVSAEPVVCGADGDVRAIVLDALGGTEAWRGYAAWSIELDRLVAEDATGRAVRTHFGAQAQDGRVIRAVDFEGGRIVSRVRVPGPGEWLDKSAWRPVTPAGAAPAAHERFDWLLHGTKVDTNEEESDE